MRSRRSAGKDTRCEGSPGHSTVPRAQSAGRFGEIAVRMGSTGPSRLTSELAGAALVRAATASLARPNGPSSKPASRSSGVQSKSPAGSSCGDSSPLVMRPSTATSGRTGSEEAASTFTCATPPSSAENATATTTVEAAWPENGTSQSDHQARRTEAASATSKATPSWAAVTPTASSHS